MTIRFQDFFTGADGTLLSAHTPDIPGAGVYTVSGPEPPDIQGNRCRARGNQVALSDIATFGPLTDGELDGRTSVKVERVSAASVMALTFQFRRHSTNHEGLELYLEFPDAANVSIRAVRRDAAGTAVELPIMATFPFAVGAKLWFGMDVAGAVATYWTAPHDGGVRTIRGTHTFGVSHADANHRHVAIITSTSVGIGVQDIARVDDFALSTVPVWSPAAPVAGAWSSPAAVAGVWASPAPVGGSWASG